MRGFFDRFSRGIVPGAAHNEDNSTPTGPLLDVVLECFRENEWRFRRGNDPNVLFFGFGGRQATYEGVIVIEEDEEEFLLLLRAPNRAPEDRRLAVAEFLTRANYVMKFGAFELDMTDGEVRFKVSAVLREGQLSTRMVHDMIGISLTTLDRFYPGLMAVCFGDQSPTKAIAMIESTGGQVG